MPVCPYLIKNVGHYWFEFRQCSKAGFNLVGIGVTILFAQCHPYSCADSGIFVRGGGGGGPGQSDKNSSDNVFFACGALAASICVGIVIPSTWLSIYITYC